MEDAWLLSTYVTLDDRKITKEERKRLREPHLRPQIIAPNSYDKASPMTKHVVVRRPMILSRDFTSTMSTPQATVKHRVKIDRRQL